MVTVLVQRQQREAAERKERLLAARQAAACHSVQQARSYRAQKHHQTEAVHAAAMQRWQETQAAEMEVLDALVCRGAAQQHDGHEAAVQHEADVQRVACEEAGAWQAEHLLETARHRLAVANTRAEAHERQRPQLAAQRRRASVRSVEKARAARVAAAPHDVPSPADILKGLRAAPLGTGVLTASIPVSTPAGGSGGGGPACASARTAAQSGEEERPALRWRMSDVAPHTRVSLHSPAIHHSGGDGDGSDSEGAAGVQRATQLYAQQCADSQVDHERVRVEGHHKAAQRALSAFRQQRDAQEEAAAAERSQRERRAAIRVIYRNPREEAVAEAAGVMGTVDAAMDGTAASPPPPPPPLQPAPLRGLTRQQQAQHAYRSGEAEFRATFVEGPPVAVEAGPAKVRTAPLDDLLRPVQVAHLLYGGATQASPVSAGEGASWQQSRVLPSAPLRMLPLQTGAWAGPQGQPTPLRSPLTPPPPPPSHIDRVASPVRTPTAAPVVSPSPPVPVLRVATPPEEIAMSPLTPHPTPAVMNVPGAAAPPHAPVQPSSPPSSHAAAVEASSPPRAESKGSSTQVSALTTPMRTPARLPPPPGHVSSSSEASSSSSSPYASSAGSGTTAGGDGESTLVESSRLSGSTATSSTRQPLPAMTAEQLRLALLRLRSRIATAPMEAKGSRCV